MAKAQMRQSLEDLKYLKDLGYKVPEVLIDLVQKKEWVRIGVRQVWKCEKCSKILEQFVNIQYASCGKHPMKKVWESGLF